MISKTLLSTLALLPLASTSANVVTIANTSNTININNSINEQEETEACTFMYVGKNVSTSGKAIMARSGDSSPRTMNHYTRVFKHNELANKVVKGKNGFEWTMPSTTYKYVSTPRNPNFQRGLNWEVSGVNEMGVGVSATLTCYTSKAALDADPLVPTGISEDNIAQIVAATASSAKDGVRKIADIINEIGSAESNAIMVIDKNETWYMEMYTGHQYVAIKMPDDKACTIGNEYLLNTLAELDHLKSAEDYFVSGDLLDIATGVKGKVKSNFAKFDSTGQATVEHLHLYNTYAGYGPEATRTQGAFGDGCHMRTWIGHYRFAENCLPYSTDGEKCDQTKYPAFFTPKASYQGGKLSEDDVISFMRDRFETVLAKDPTSDNDSKYFHKVKASADGLRVVGIENAYQIHVISVDPNLPAEIAVTELMCLSNSNYSPFIPFNNGINSVIDEYSKVVTDFTYDDTSAPSIYKKLNALAATNRENYGLPIVPYIQEHEQAWRTQYYDLLNQTKDKTLAIAQNALTNYCKSLQVQGLEMSKVLFNDLLFHIENTIVGVETKYALFEPLVNLEYYANLYGWKYERSDKIVTLKSNEDVIKFNIDYKWNPDVGKYFGKMQVNDEAEVDIIMHMTDNIPYVSYNTVKSPITTNHEVVKVNINDYITSDSKPFNHLIWIIPSLVGIPLIVGAIVVPISISRNKKLSLKSQSKK